MYLKERWMGNNKTTKQFIVDAKRVHGNKYGYNLVIYTNNKTAITIICADHGTFLQRPDNHLSGQGCPVCGTNAARLKQSHPLQVFIDKANKIHNFLYDYSLVNYINIHANVVIICKSHGEFSQEPNGHLRGNGCHRCGHIKTSSQQTHSLQEFVDKANIVHNFRYNYNSSHYVSSSEPLTIACKEHGNFSQTPNNHLRKNGCPQCVSNVSKVETQWLDRLNIHNDYRQTSITINGKLYRPDAFDPTTNTIYEFYGDFWHGNPSIYDANEENPLNYKTYGELYKNTMLREEQLKLAGYNIISIWESDFKKIIDKTFRIKTNCQ
jgi:Zn finger protein HypA/HybF involved in hydrogenase expression